MTDNKKKPALVVLSGGQDSTTCLYWALREYGEVRAITFDYGQRHAVEVNAAMEIANGASIRHHKVLPLGVLNSVSESALTRPAIKVSSTGGHHGLPSTFVPGRNLVFLTLAAAYAISNGIDNIVTGVCQTDYSGYPDCRRSTIDALETAIRLGNDLGEEFRIHTPLMFLTKAQSVLLAKDLGGECMCALGLTVTCYHGRRPGCGVCPACVLRAKGFEEAGIPDPAYA